MMKVVLLLALAVFVTANPRSLKVQENAHEIARSVKSSSEYTLEEKEQILADLKAINKDAKEFSSAHGHKKSQLKKDLHEKLASLKSEMHETRNFEEDRQKEKVSKIQQDLKGVKAEIKAAHLKSSEKRQAKALYKTLKEEYSRLQAQTTKEGRKAIAREMKETTKQLKKQLTPLSEKKQNILSMVQSTEAEYDGKKLTSSAKRQIHSAFEEMKSELNTYNDAAQLKGLLKEKIASISKIEANSNKELEEKEKDDDLDFDDDEDLEEDNSEDDSSNKERQLEESISEDDE